MKHEKGAVSRTLKLAIVSASSDHAHVVENRRKGKDGVGSWNGTLGVATDVERFSSGANGPRDMRRSTNSRPIFVVAPRSERR